MWFLTLFPTPTSYRSMSPYLNQPRKIDHYAWITLVLCVIIFSTILTIFLVSNIFTIPVIFFIKYRLLVVNPPLLYLQILVTLLCQNRRSLNHTLWSLLSMSRWQITQLLFPTYHHPWDHCMGTTKEFPIVIHSNLLWLIPLSQHRYIFHLLVICPLLFSMCMWILYLRMMLQVVPPHHVVSPPLVCPYFIHMKTSWKPWAPVIILGMICTIMHISFHNKSMINILWSP